MRTLKRSIWPFAIIGMTLSACTQPEEKITLEPMFDKYGNVIYVPTPDGGVAAVDGTVPGDTTNQNQNQNRNQNQNTNQNRNQNTNTTRTRTGT